MTNVQEKIAMKLKKDLEEKLTYNERTLTMYMFEVGRRVRMEALMSGNKNWFMENLQHSIKHHNKKAPTDKMKFKDFKVLMKKLERVGLMKIDLDGLPLWGYRELERNFGTWD